MAQLPANPPEPIAFDRFDPLDSALRREWLETNGLGGYASATITGTNTRRYHGLLIAALKPPVERYVLWSRNEEELTASGQKYELSTNLYPGAVHPQGYLLQRHFALLPWPTFDYAQDGWSVRKSVFMVNERNLTVVAYENTGSGPLTLLVRPLLAFRDYHGHSRENGWVNTHLSFSPGRAWLRPYAGLPAMHVHHNAQDAGMEHLWYRRFEYPREIERGFDGHEDLFSLFTLTFHLSPGQTGYLAMTTEEGAFDFSTVHKSELVRRSSPDIYRDARVNLLARSAGSFLVRRGEKLKTVIAGYHWFSDWGRDTMISLPGLCLLDQDTLPIARDILLAFAEHCDRGMIPNRFPDSGETPEYNTVDAALWFVHAVTLYFERSQDKKTLAESLFPAVESILTHYRSGTRFNIHADENGLIYAGEAGTQLTWMDAKIGSYVVTPRQGQPVEINALWYNALRRAGTLAAALQRPDPHAKLAEQVRAGFNRNFWNPQANCLYDVLTSEGPDASIRPNQIFAVSLQPDLLPRERQAAVVQKVRKELLTPYGLRTLSPSDSRYHPRYEGDSWSRDTAYHQGTVWPWLIGAYCDALITVEGSGETTRGQIRTVLEPLLFHLHEAGLGSISEIYDGDAPHRPCGCIAQAWSVAEVLRVWRQYVEKREAKEEPTREKPKNRTVNKSK